MLHLQLLQLLKSAYVRSFNEGRPGKVAALVGYTLLS